MAYKDPEVRREHRREYRATERGHALMRAADLALYQKKKQDPDFIRKKREKNARYRARNRQALAAKENDRYKRNLAERPEETREKIRLSSARRRAAHPPNAIEIERRRLASRDTYRKNRTDPVFKSANVARVMVWYKQNPERAKRNAMLAHRRRLLTDVNYKLAIALRRRLRKALRNKGYRSGISLHIGCSVEFLKTHLEGLFEPGMTWDNWGVKGWHIDHILPFAVFDLGDESQLKAACHWTNLQPLWAAQNISKGARLLPIPNWRPGAPSRERWANVFPRALAAVQANKGQNP